MPLVRDEQRGTDRLEKPSPWPWALAILGFVVFLGVAFLLIGFFTVQTSVTATPAATVGSQMNSNWLQQAQTMSGYGDFTNAAIAISNIDETQPMQLTDKHTFLGLAAETNTKAGKAKIGAGYYERYLSLGASIHKKECAECHDPPATIPPTRLADMVQSDRGTAYAAALTTAGSLKSRRDALVKELKQKPNEARLHILLYHLEKALENKVEAKKHANALSALDVKARSTPAVSTP